MDDDIHGHEFNHDPIMESIFQFFNRGQEQPERTHMASKGMLHNKVHGSSLKLFFQKYFQGEKTNFLKRFLQWACMVGTDQIQKG